MGSGKWHGRKIPFTPTEKELENNCIYIERQRRVEGNVVFYEFLYLPNIGLPKFINQPLENKSLYEMLFKKYKIEIKGGERKLWAVAADEQSSHYLEVKKGSPQLRLERRIDTN